MKYLHSGLLRFVEPGVHYHVSCQDVSIMHLCHFSVLCFRLPTTVQNVVGDPIVSSCSRRQT